MNIVVNAQVLIEDRLDGIGWFTYETMKRITESHPEHNFFLILDRKPSSSYSFSFPANTRMLVLSPQSRHPFLWFLRFEILMPLMLKRLKADLFVSPDGWMTTSTSIPCVQVLHDLNFVHNPEDVPFWTRIYYNYLFPRYARKAVRVATVSIYSKKDIIKTYGIPEEKIDVTPNGCSLSFVPATIREQEETRSKYTQGHPFFLFVGAVIPRKNIVRLFKAFDQFKATDPGNTKLVMVGHRRWWTTNIRQAYEEMQYKNEVIFLPNMSQSELQQLYSSSIALVFVPYFEGFGIPILEAFNCDTAVITSNVTSMPEVAGDAAMLVDPYSTDEICAAMKKIITEPDFRNSLIEKGRIRRKSFSWDITAEKLWNCILNASRSDNKS